MRTARRFVDDEHGVALPLAMIMIVLIGVMGAALLTFTSRDLNTAIEENRGQRAFEMADAGIEAAKRQLASGVDTTKYDDPVVNPPAPVNDIQWSAAAGGLWLRDLDGDGTITDSVNVKIKYRSDTEDFLVVSEGDYGAAKRKIEATFEAVPPAVGPEGTNQGQPLYYTPSSIMIDGPNVGIKGISMFTRKDVLIEDGRVNPTTDYSYSCFKADYADDTKNTNNCDGTNMPAPGTLAKLQGVGDELCDWDSAPPEFASGACFKVQGQPAGQGNYNTNGRTTLKNGSPVKVQDVGFGAEGTICSVPPGSANTIGTCAGRTSIASAVDGYVYDSTTSPQFIAKELWNPPLDPGANGPDTPPGTITYPFPRLVPNAEYFKGEATDPIKGAGYWVGQPTDPTWGLTPSSANKVAFVDAQGGTVRFDPPGQGGTTGATGTSYKGMIVVWCGDLQQDDNFRGIIFNLYGDDLDGNTQCGNDVDGPSADNVGVYSNNGMSCTCWVYAEGGTSTRAGIILGPGSSADFLPAGVWDSNLPSDAFEGPPPTEFMIRSWRELYE